MRLSKWDGVSLLALACASMMTIAVFDRLPDPIPTHFDLHGTPNGWMPRAVGAWFAPVFGLAIYLFVRFAPRVLPSAEKKRLSEGQVALVASLTTLFLVAVHALILYVAVVPGASLIRPIWLLLGAFFVALGLILPRIKRNAFVGIRTAWTLTSDENWARSNRIGGYSMVLGGIGAAAAGILGGAAGGVVAIAFLLVSAFVPAIYSLVLARRGNQG